MWSGVSFAVSCVTDTMKKSLLKATGPLPGKGTWAHTVRGLYLDGRTLRPSRHPGLRSTLQDLPPGRRGPQGVCQEGADISKR